MMPVLVQRAWYTRQQLRSQPDCLFAWGDNLVRAGSADNPKSGQAFACRDEPNAVGMPTKRYPSMRPDAFLSDADFDRVCGEIDAAMDELFAAVRAGRTVIWPGDGIGTGRAELSSRAPRVWRYLEAYRTDLFAAGEAREI